MKKPGHHETRVTRGFVGSLVRSRLADFLSIRLLLMDAIRRFAACRQSPRVVERRTAEQDLNNAPGIDHDLMWTWFLPNPLWPPNKSTWKL
jgi:hypothetical protein